MSDKLEDRQIPALEQPYGHARRAYGLVSALLMAWELIGIELEASPFQYVKLQLKSPQAAPYVLIVLIIYFGARVTIEWYQNDIRRRKLLASRIDFAMSHTIAIAALALYGFQALSNIQLANIITRNQFVVFLLGLLSGFTISELVIGWRRRPRTTILSIINWIPFVLVTSWLTFHLIVLGILGDRSHLFFGLAGVAVGIIPVVLFRWFDRRMEASAH